MNTVYKLFINIIICIHFFELLQDTICHPFIKNKHDRNKLSRIKFHPKQFTKTNLRKVVTARGLVRRSTAYNDRELSDYGYQEWPTVTRFTYTYRPQQITIETEAPVCEHSWRTYFPPVRSETTSTIQQYHVIVNDDVEDMVRFQRNDPTTTSTTTISTKTIRRKSSTTTTTNSTETTNRTATTMSNNTKATINTTITPVPTEPAKCYECGLTVNWVGDVKIPTAECFNVFDSEDTRDKAKRNKYKNRNCEDGYKSGCFKRFLDVGVVYNERGCRTWPPARGKSYASNRLAKMEMMLKYREEGCVVSPEASLTPFARGVSLWARYHVCVCQGRYCNAARARASPARLLVLLAVFSAARRVTWRRRRCH